MFYVDNIAPRLNVSEKGLGRYWSRSMGTPGSRSRPTKNLSIGQQ
jgi:hypothetical protein